jgi:GTP-binding protein
MLPTNATFLKSSTLIEQCPAPDKPEFAFIGRSNVGKSSLINMLVNKKNMAKTSGTPGKTRLINHFEITSNSGSWYLVDLPGYGYAKISRSEREKWEIMIDQYLSDRENLVCTFVLIDVRHEPQKNDLEFCLKLGQDGIPFALVFTKADKEKLDNDLKQQKYDEQITKDAKDQADAIKKIFEDTRTPLENYTERIQNLQTILGKGLIDPDTFSRAVGLANKELTSFTEKGKSDIDILTDAINGFGNEFTSTLTEAFMTGKLNFTDMVNSIQRDIIRMMIKKNITDPSVSFLTDLFKGFGGARALGGPVSSNTPYMVGERGPELFVPNGSGNIVPNNKLGGGGVTVVQNINIDSRTDRSSIMAAMNQAKEQAKAEIYRSMKSGGAFA